MAATTSTTGSALALSGLASGLDWTSIVSEMLTVEAAPETQMNATVTADQNKNAGLQTINTDLTKLQTDVTTLSNPDFFDSRIATPSDTSVATATADTGTPLGTYKFVISQLATDASQQGTADISQSLNSTNNVSALTLSSAGFSTPVTAGTFTVNGQTVTVATSDTLQNVFDNISTATGGAVTGSYNASTDEITLSSSSAIVLGSATDSSNFLSAAELYNNGTGTVSSASSLGGVNLAASADDANLRTTISDGGSGAGAFTINGVTINYDSSTDSISTILANINDSAAGVTATYDSQNDSFTLTNKTTGDVGISMQDVTGNFLAATGLSGGTLARGNNLLYTVNGGSKLTSQSNTITGASSGLTGLSVTAQAIGTTNITVGTDTTTISNAISSFVTDYNAVQTYISGQTASTTSSSGDVTPGLFTGNMDVENIADSLRQMADASPTGGSTGVQDLNDLGVASNGNDNTLSFSTPSDLTTALSTNLAAVKNLFTNSTTGIATTLQNYLDTTLSPNGVLQTDETNLTNEANTVTDSINNLKSRISNDQVRLDTEFTNMETAINSINTEKSYLNSYFGGSSSAQSAPTAAGSGASSASTS